MRIVAPIAIAFATAVASGGTLSAQAAPPSNAQTGVEISGLPALNFNSDEGIGYGVIVQAFDYGAGLSPYRFTIQPSLLMTTRGRRDISVLIDAPHVFPGWRIGAFLAREQHVATPYYGVGNATGNIDALQEEPNPYYYRYGRKGYRVTADVQRQIRPSLRVLGGVGFRTSEIDKTPFDSGATLLVDESGAAPLARAKVAHARVGIVLDTRDHEIGPRRGVWIEALAQRASRPLAGYTAFSRATLTARGYVSPTQRVTFAERLILQQLDGTVPFYELFAIQGSYKDDEGLGGGGTLRGWPKNRFAGKGMALLNSEVRVRAAEFRVRGRESAVVLSGFVDAGRVWSDRIRLGEIASDLHVGTGGGVRLAYGRGFVVALDVGHSKESTAAIYLGMGYVY